MSEPASIELQVAELSQALAVLEDVPIRLGLLEANPPADALAANPASLNAEGKIEDAIVATSLAVGAGDLIGAAVAVPPAAHRLDVRDGTAGAPVKIGASASYSRTDATTRAEVNAMGPVGTDGPDGATVLRAAIKGTAASQVQICALVASAWQTGESGLAGNDACPLYGSARVSLNATGRAIGAYIQSSRETATSSGQQAVELRVKNTTGVSDAYVLGGPSKSMAIWLNASGTADSAAGIQFGHGFEHQFDVGIGFNTESIKTTSLRDDSNAIRSILIRGAHEKGAIIVAAGAGPVVLGAEEGTAGTHLFELFNNETKDPIAKVGSNAAGANTSIEWHNAAGNMKIFMAGGANTFLTGTVNGDSGVNFTPGKTWHVGAQGKSGMLRVSEAGLGFFGHAPVAQPAKPEATAAAIITALESIGIFA